VALVRRTEGKESSLLPRRLPTPTTNGLNGGSDSPWFKTGETQTEYVLRWPTPTASPSTTGQTVKTTKKLLESRDRKQGSLIERVVERMWPTPNASDNRDRGHLGSGAVQRRMEKGKQIMLSQSVSKTSGALNPTWVEWLMGFPIGWTDLKHLEMQLSLKSQNKSEK